MSAIQQEQEPSLPKRLALVVGVNAAYPAYAYIAPLQYAESGAAKLAQVLQESCNFELSSPPLLGEQATTEVVKKAIRHLAMQRTDQDCLLFYFAGHGYPLVDDASQFNISLITHDFDPKIIDELGDDDAALSLKWLSNVLYKRTKAGSVLLILDCCYAGNIGSLATDRPLDAAFDALKQYFVPSSTQKKGTRATLAAAAPGAVAWERDGDSVMTAHLLKALNGGYLEAVNDAGQVTLERLQEVLRQHMPVDQKYSFSGEVIGDVFVLATHSQLSARARQEREQATQKTERKQMLYAMCIDHSGFLQDRLSSFVGRTQELIELRLIIRTLFPTGGYLTITGQAGQGKSSINAKLVEIFDPAKTPHHFIPFNPGPDYQVTILRDLMAQLILKYDLSDLYVASESRAALRDFFPKVLADIVEKGGEEIIFVDGLDQLKVDMDGERDLSFLPTNPPPGIVFVLGTRPNDTLRPLKLLKPHKEYRLPNLSRDDFDLILKHRSVQIEEGLANRFYQAMQENALYLDLVARELTGISAIKHEEMIQRVAINPANIFSLSMTRLKRHSQWREIIKPVLGILLVAREPLSLLDIRSLIGAQHDELREGIERLGGLLAEDRRRRYSLFHLKLYDYLRQDESTPDKEYLFAIDEEKAWHKRLSRWCELTNMAIIWQDVPYDVAEQSRREYARQHYITHLYNSEDWQKMFAVLDEGGYGRGKIRSGLGTRAYVQDLYLGLQASMWKERSLKDAVAMLPHMWRYALLRSSLSSYADHYSLAMFEVLILRKREAEALGLAELLTNVAYKVKVLIHIALLLGKEVGRERESIQLLMRASESAKIIRETKEGSTILQQLIIALIQSKQWEQAEKTIHLIEDPQLRANELKTLSLKLAQAQQWERAEVVVYSINDHRLQIEALTELSKALAYAQQWERAETIIRSLQETEQQIRGLIELGKVFTLTHQQERAQAIWVECEAIVSSRIPRFKEQMLAELSKVFTQLQQWERAQTIIDSITKSFTHDNALVELGKALAQAQQWKQAQAIVDSIPESDRLQRERILAELGKALAQAQQWKQAQAVISSFEFPLLKIEVKVELGKALAKTKQWEEANRVINSIEQYYWNAVEYIDTYMYRTEVIVFLGERLIQEREWKKAESIILSIPGQSYHQRTIMLRELIKELLQAGKVKSAEDIIYSSSEGEQRKLLQQEFMITLAKRQQWEKVDALFDEAKKVEPSIEEISCKALSLIKLGKALAQVQQQERAEIVYDEAEMALRSIREMKQQTEISTEMVRILAQAQQWERAEALASSIEERESKAQALAAISGALAQAQQWERAEALASSIEERESKAQALAAISGALAQAQQWERAEALASSIEEPLQKSSALAELVKALIGAQRRTPAKRIIESIDNSWSHKEAMLTALGKAFIHAKEWNKADAIIPSIHEENLLIEFFILFSQCQQWQRAETAWTRIEKQTLAIKVWEQRAQKQMMQANTLARAQQWEHAEKIILSIEEWVYRAIAQRKFSSVLALAQQWERAKEVAFSIDIPEERADALMELGKELALHRQLSWKEIMQQAYSTSCSIWNEWEKAKIQCRLSIKLVKIQQWQWAENIIKSIQVDRWKAEALLEMGKVLAFQHYWQWAKDILTKAEIIASAIEEQAEGAKVLRMLSVVLAQTQQWQWAEKVARLIPVRTERIEALQELGKMLIQAEQWEQGIELWTEAQLVIEDAGTEIVMSSSISEEEFSEQASQPFMNISTFSNPWREEILYVLADDLQKAGEYERLLRMVQHMWLNANTRIYTTNLLTLAIRLIPLNPAIGTAFCDAFSWVDAFLKEEK
jgi:Caspase domain